MRILTLGCFILMAMPTFAADGVTTQVAASPEPQVTSVEPVVDECTQLANSVVTEFHRGLTIDGFDAMTSLQHVQVFMAHRVGLKCENTPEFLANLAKAAADKYQIKFDFENGITPDKVLTCNAIVDSANASYTVGANPDHGIAPDGDSILSMTSTQILVTNYYSGGCETILGNTKNFVNKILEGYQQSKLNKKAETPEENTF